MDYYLQITKVLAEKQAELDNLRAAYAKLVDQIKALQQEAKERG